MDRGDFEKLIAPYEKVVIDIGTGDGLLVYNYAHRNPQTFFIGIDANRKPLEKISHKIYRKAARGGLPNIIFLQASVEALPDELTGIASELEVNFPWGGLLRTVIGGESLNNLYRLCAPNALLKVVVAIDLAKDRAELARLGLSNLSDDYLRNVVPTNYRGAGFEIFQIEKLEPSEILELSSSWARRLARSSNRSFTRILARAVPLKY